MPQLLINCPKTGKPLGTGIAMDAESLATSVLENNTCGPCPHCGEDHVWSKPDAWLMGDGNRPETTQI